LYFVAWNLLPPDYRLRLTKEEEKLSGVFVRFRA
jgi:hypothetical protein